MTRPNFITLTDEQVRARKRRNVAIALGLVGFIVLVFIVTVTNLQRNTQARKAAEAAAKAAEEAAAAEAEALRAAAEAEQAAIAAAEAEAANKPAGDASEEGSEEK